MPFSPCGRRRGPRRDAAWEDEGFDRPFSHRCGRCSIVGWTSEPPHPPIATLWAPPSPAGGEGKLTDLIDVTLLTLKLAALTTVLLLVMATPLAWWLGRSRSWWSEAVA